MTLNDSYDLWILSHKLAKANGVHCPCHPAASRIYGAGGASVGHVKLSVAWEVFRFFTFLLFISGQGRSIKTKHRKALLRSSEFLSPVVCFGQDKHSMFDMVLHLFTRNLLMFCQRPPANHLITPSSRTSTREVCSRLFMLKMSRLLGVQSSDSTGAVAVMSTPTFFITWQDISCLWTAFNTKMVLWQWCKQTDNKRMPNIFTVWHVYVQSKALLAAAPDLTRSSRWAFLQLSKCRCAWSLQGFHTQGHKRSNLRVQAHGVILMLCFHWM